MSYCYLWTVYLWFCFSTDINSVSTKVVDLTPPIYYGTFGLRREGLAREARSDCGVFSLAFALVLAAGGHPSKYLFDQQAMSPHLHDWGVWSPFLVRRQAREEQNQRCTSHSSVLPLPHASYIVSQRKWFNVTSGTASFVNFYYTWLYFQFLFAFNNFFQWFVWSVNSIHCWRGCYTVGNDINYIPVVCSTANIRSVATGYFYGLLFSCLYADQEFWFWDQFFMEFWYRDQSSMNYWSWTKNPWGTKNQLKISLGD